MKFVVFIISFLFLIIIILTLFTFEVGPFTLQKNENIITSSKIVHIISSQKSKTFSNPLNTWKNHVLQNNKIKVLSPIEISASMSATISPNSPASSSAGIIFSNNLTENDPNIRSLSLYYYLKNQQWLLKYQAGNTTKFYGLTTLSEKKSQSHFSLLIAADGKNVLILFPDKSTRLIHFPNSLYDVTNQMGFYALTGPKSSIKILKLQYRTIPQ